MVRTYSSKNVKAILAKMSLVERHRLIGSNFLRRILESAPEDVRKRLYHALAMSLGFESQLDDTIWHARIYRGTGSRIPGWFSSRNVEEVLARYPDLVITKERRAAGYSRIQENWKKWDVVDLIRDVEDMFRELKHSSDAEKGLAQATRAGGSATETADRRLASQILKFVTSSQGWGRVQHYHNVLELAKKTNKANGKKAIKTAIDHFTALTYPQDAPTPNQHSGDWKKRRHRITHSKALGDKVATFTEAYGNGVMVPLALCLAPSNLDGWTRWEIDSILLALETADDNECYLLLSRLVEAKMEEALATGSAEPFRRGWADELLVMTGKNPHQRMDAEESASEGEEETDEDDDFFNKDDDQRDHSGSHMTEDGNRMDVDGDEVEEKQGPLMAAGALDGEGVTDGAQDYEERNADHDNE